MRSMITIVSYIALAVASAVIQAPTWVPVAQSERQEKAKSPRLSPPEISQLRTKANAGDAGAQASLGKAYQDGNGVSHNDAMALQWYRKAADQGDAEAESALGIIYRMGEGVRPDTEEAVRWYRRSCQAAKSTSHV